ncbi:RNA-directed DNA polymerase, eukaryota, reverse transcriptase zinc-binding domain protein [Tanacetum coccineum]
MDGGNEEIGSIEETVARNPKGGVEAFQFTTLKNTIECISLTDQRDSWQWVLGSSVGFSVASVRLLIDSRTLDTDNVATRWNRSIPIKVNMFLWRLKLNKLPSRVNLDRRGIEVDYILCPSCLEDIETVNHSFFNCGLAKDLWALLAKWWELDIPICGSIVEWYDWLDSLYVSSKVRLLLEGMRGTLMWTICYNCWKDYADRDEIKDLSERKYRLIGEQEYLQRQVLNNDSLVYKRRS